MIGLVLNTNEEYHAGEGISVSGLKLMQRSPLHYWAAYLDPDRKPRDPSPAMMIGTAIHTAALEPDEFPYRYAVVPDGIDRRSKEGKALFAEIEASGKTPLKPEQYETINKAAASVRCHPLISDLLAMPGKVEQAIYWLDQDTGVLCKMRADYMIEPCAEYPNGLLLDLKSADDASAEGFSRAAFNYAYHMQAPWYMEGFRQHFQTPEHPPFLFAVVEKAEPFASAVYSVSDQEVRIGGEILPATPEFLALGRQTNAELLDLYSQCSQSGSWPGYPREVSPLVLPAWVAKNLSNEEEIEVSYV